MRWFGFVIAISSMPLFSAQSSVKFLCQKNSEQRAIEVVYESPKRELPCKVVQHYHWGVESQHRKVDKFWAKNTSGYCEQKAEWLAMKRLRELNWDCKRVKKLS